MSIQVVKGLDEARRIYDANITPRARTLMLFESEVEGTRFDHLPEWFSSDEPIFNRKPCVIYRCVEASIQSKTDMLLGEGRFPRITAAPEEDEDSDETNAATNDDGLNEEDSDVLDAAVAGILREARLPALYREMYRSCQGCGTTVALLGVRNAKLFAETLDVKFCTIVRTPLREIESLTVEYPYITNMRDSKGEWRAYCMVYRRVIDATSDTLYKPALAKEDGSAPSWQVLTRTDHNLGFVPVIWHRYAAPMMHMEDEDGHPVHRTILGELEAIHYALSQRHHGALHSLPQVVEIGVDMGYNPTAPAGSIHDRIAVTPNPKSAPGGHYQAVRSSKPTGNRKKGPNNVWQYPSKDTRVESIETPATALEALDVHIKDLRSKICETLAWAPLDPEAIKFAATVSGRALEVLRERELNRVSYDREIFGEEVILGVVRMLLRIALKLSSALRTPKLKPCLPLLEKFAASETWIDPILYLKWPAYFMPTADDKSKTIAYTVMALEKGTITRRTAVESTAWIFGGVRNVKKYMEKLEKEREENAQQQLDDSIALAEATAKYEYGGEGPPKKKPTAKKEAKSSD